MTNLNQAQQFNLTLTPTQVTLFEQYQDLLLDWNQRFNLTRIVDPAEITSKHFLDSLSIYSLFPPAARSVIDIGSGAGFPGLPLAIARPDLTVTLLESTGKKCRFLEAVVSALALPNVSVVQARAEEAGQDRHHREQYEVAVARAVSRLPVLVEYMLPLVKVGGVMIAQKGQDPPEELQAARRAIGILGGGSPKVQPVTVPGLEATRHGVVIKKIKPTSKRYPRRPGLPNKEPL